MDTKITSIAVHQREGGGSITKYGLGEDNHLYTWNSSLGRWEPDWDTRTPEQKEEAKRAMAHQFRPNHGNGNPAY